jgi:hypothetical protein
MRTFTLSDEELIGLGSLQVGQALSYIDGYETRSICQVYADRTLLIVSQLGKVGYLTQVIFENKPTASVSSYVDVGLRSDVNGGSSHSTEPGSPHRHAEGSTPKVLLGSQPSGERALYGLYASQIAAAALDSGGDFSGAQFRHPYDANPAIVGLSLGRRARSSFSGENGIDEGDDSDDLDPAIVGKREQERFRRILRLVCTAYANMR